MSARISDVLAELESAAMPVDHEPGENGVASLCPLCVREMIWIEGSRSWVCNSGCDGCRIADAVYFRGERTGDQPSSVTDAPPPFALLDFEDLLVQPDLAYLIDG